MFKLGSEDRQRKSAVLQIVRKSVPSGRAGVAEWTSSICRQKWQSVVMRLAAIHCSQSHTNEQWESLCTFFYVFLEITLVVWIMSHDAQKCNLHTSAACLSFACDLWRYLNVCVFSLFWLVTWWHLRVECSLLIMCVLLLLQMLRATSSLIKYGRHCLYNVTDVSYEFK